MTLSAQRPESDGNFSILSLDNTFHQACLQWLSLLKKLLNACHKYEMPIIIKCIITTDFYFVMVNLNSWTRRT